MVLQSNSATVNTVADKVSVYEAKLAAFKAKDVIQKFADEELNNRIVMCIMAPNTSEKTRRKDFLAFPTKVGLGMAKNVI